MEEQEISEGNKIIGTFMGKNFSDPLNYMYDKSWNWLMKVIEKIESLETNKEAGEQFQFSITGDGIVITKFDDGSGVIASRVNYIGKSKLQSSYEVVVDFIKFYNQSRKS